jgi:anti-sigma factor RsiW
VDCDDARVLMHGHFDDELDLAADLEVRRHIDQCPRCVTEYAALRAMRTRLNDEEFRFEAPPELREKIRRAIIASPQTRSASQRSGGYQAQRRPWLPRAIGFVVPMAIGAMLALIIAPRTMGPSRDQQIAGEVIASHVRSLMPAHLMDVESTDQHTVKPWFNGRLDFSPPVTDFAKEGFPLVGGRLDYIDGRPVAALVYQHGKHVINVFMWPSAGTATSVQRIETEHAYNVEQLTVGGMNCWVVSDLNEQELDNFAGLLRAKG